MPARKAPGGVKARNRSRLNKRVSAGRGRAAAKNKTPASVSARRRSRFQNAQRKMAG